MERNNFLPVKIVRPDHFELLGEGYVLLTAPHAAVPDLHIGQIVEDAALTSRSYAVVGKVSPEYQDLERVQVARTELQKSIIAMIQDSGIRHVIDIQGKEDTGVSIGTVGTTVSPETTELVRTRLAKTFAVNVNTQPEGLRPGNIIASDLIQDAVGESSIETLQLEFGQRERSLQRDMIVKGLVELVRLLNRRLEFRESSTE